MRLYETAFLIAPNLSDEEIEKLILQMSEVVTKKKGKMVNLDKWGKRKLAYPINKFDDAFYFFFLYEGDPAIPTELERRFKQTETIIRYMTVKVEPGENIRKKKKTSKGKELESSGEEEKNEKKEEVKKSEKPEEKITVDEGEKLVEAKQVIEKKEMEPAEEKSKVGE